MKDQMQEQREQQQGKYWDETEFYKKEVWPKLNEVQKLCEQRRIPFQALAITQHAATGTATSTISYIEDRGGEYVHRMAAIAAIFNSPHCDFLTSGLKVLAELVQKEKEKECSAAD